MSFEFENEFEFKFKFEFEFELREEEEKEEEKDKEEELIEINSSNVDPKVKLFLISRFDISLRSSFLMIISLMFWLWL